MSRLSFNPAATAHNTALQSVELPDGLTSSGAADGDSFCLDGDRTLRVMKDVTRRMLVRVVAVS